MRNVLIDTHCHLNHEQFDGEVDLAITRAQACGVQWQIVVGFDLESSRKAVNLAESHESLFAAVGIHPHDAMAYSCDTDAEIKSWLGHHKVVALGEIGLDFYRNLSEPSSQYDALYAQLALAKQADKPIIFHCREAYSELLGLLEQPEWRGIRGVMHCWAGNIEEVRRTGDLGLFMGFGGVLTFKNAQLTRDCMLAAPTDQIVLETDAPYLAPVPYRGKRNEPAYVLEVARKISELTGSSVDEVAATTTANAARLFGINIG